MPVVKGHKVLDQGSEHRHLLLGVVVHDLLGQGGLVDLGAVEAQLLMHKALLVGDQAARGNGIVVRGVVAVELNVVAVDGMIRVVGNGIKVVGSRAHLTSGGLGQIIGVAKGATLLGVVEAFDTLPAQEVVE